MTQDVYLEQASRLREHFTPRAISKEFALLIWPIVQDLTEPEFRKVVDTMIGSRRYNNPPVEADFREAYYQITKRRFDREVQAASTKVFGNSKGERLAHVKDLMQKFYNASSIQEAIRKKAHG